MTVTHVGRRRRGRMALSTLVGVAMVAALAIPGSGALAGRQRAQASGFAPYQLVSKAFTEVLGRAPGNGDWNTRAINYWAGQSGCTAPSVVGFIQQFTNAASPELATHNYSSAQLAIMGFRLVLNRDPGPGSGFTNFVSYVTTHGGGTTGFTALVNNLMNQPEFASDVANKICSGNPAYGFGTSQAIDPNNPSGAGSANGQPYGVTDDTAYLQYLVNTAPAGLVTLPAGTVWGIKAPIDVPTGVTLETAGTPAATGYLNLARIVKLPGFSPSTGDDPMIRLEGSAQLDYTWVDGQSGVGGVPNDQSGIGGQDVETRDMTQTAVPVSGTIADDRLDNAASKQVVSLWGPGDGIPSDTAPCATTYVIFSLITGYRAIHTGNQALQDGVQVYCGAAVVAYNYVVDETDAPIVVFGPNGYDQASNIEYNEILSAGNSAYYGIALDPGLGSGSTHLCTSSSAHGDEGTFGNNPITPANYSKNYANAKVQYNALWTSPETFLDVVLSIGSHELQGSCEHPGSGSTGLNANGPVTVTGNQSDNELSLSQIGIYVGGLFSAQIDNTNAFPHVISPGGNCRLQGGMVVVAGNGTSYPNYATGLVTTISYLTDSTGIDDQCNLSF